MIREKKIDAMHKVYGVFVGGKCKSCAHLEPHVNADCTRCWYKCLMYGTSCGEGTDWRAGWEACNAICISPGEARRRGLYGNVYRQTKGIRRKPKQREELPGQLQMEI